jgi:hypothetical protein
MSDLKDQLPSSNPLPATLQTLVGYATALFAGWLLRRGIIGENDTALLQGLALALAAAGWGVYKTLKHKREVARAALLPPTVL